MKKRLLLRSSGMITCLLLALFIISIWEYQRPIAPNSPEGLKMAEFNRKRERRLNGYAKQDKPDEFMLMHREMRTADGESGPNYPMNYKFTEMLKAGAIGKKDGKLFSKAFKADAQLAALPWVERGPSNIGGRTRGLIVDPDDGTHNTWFAGSVGGGIWKTTNAGASWTNLTPDLPNLATTVLVMAASDHDVIYAGTGEGFGNVDGIDGDGIWKSTDRGVTWTQLASTVALNQSNTNFRNVNRIIVSPTDENIVIAATNNGIYRSINGGDSWATSYASPGPNIQHVIANPLNFNTQYAGTSSGTVLKSTDGGVSWFSASSGLSGNRVELAISPVDTNRVFASVDIGSGDNGRLFMTLNGGNFWERLIVNAPATSTEFDFLGGQGWYDNTIAAHPYNDSTVFVGGVDVFKVIARSIAVSSRGISSIDYDDTDSFLSFTPFTGGYTTGIGYGGDYFGGGSYGMSAGDCTSVEIRFGTGLSQKAHRMNRAFLTDNSYTYIDYSDVPFQVWDITNNRQLMVSYLDSSNNGFFNLSVYDGVAIPREAIFINAIPYNASAPFDSIVAGHGGKEGHKYKNSYVITPALASGAIWNPTTLPTSTLRINFGQNQTRTSITTTVTDGYNQYTGGDGGPHVDHHNLVIIPVSAPNNFKILNGSDGGLALSTDGGSSFIKTQENIVGYNTSQFYGIDKKPGINQYIGGMQDNSSYRSPADPTSTSAWTFMIGGDGFDAVWKYDDGNSLIASSQFNGFRRSVNGGSTWYSITSGIDVGGGNAPFTSPIGRSKMEPDIIYAVGARGVFRSTNFGTNWTLTSITGTNWGPLSSLATVEVSLANPSIVWAGQRMTSAGKINVSTDGGATFTPTVNYTTVTLGSISGLATHPSDDSTAYALFSIADRPKILRTTNLGQSWEDISGFGTNPNSSNGFPDVAVYSLLVMPHNLNEIWVGTEIGLFISTDNGATWAYSNNGLPAVSIWDMKIVDKQVVLATHGRGIWTLDIPELPDIVMVPKISGAGQNPNGKVGIGMRLRESYDSTLVYLNNVKMLTIGNVGVKDTSVEISTLLSGSVPVQLVGYKGGLTYKSIPQTITITQSVTPLSKYVNNFNSASSDFSGNGFTITQPSGFSNPAIHTAHPYSDNQDLIYKLNVPVVVASGTSKLVFDEIAIVEPGDPGTVFGDPNFWDYVIVEATSDGITWIPLEDGWDARRHSEWVSAYNSGSAGTPSLFRRHEINLLSKFSAGTPIFIRFRLYADELTNGWGWAIDNVNINGDQTSPSLVLGVLASPVVNVVRFAVGADESIISVALSVNSTPITLTKQGNLYFGNYTITAVGSLNTTVSATDSTLNPSSFSRSYTISQLSKSTPYHNYSFSGQGNGYILLGQSIPLNVPSNFKLIGQPVDVAVTGSYADLKAEFAYDAGAIRAEVTGFDEAKIGVYQFTNGTWLYAGGMGDKGKVASAVTSNQIAVFYNPDFDATPKNFALEKNYPNPFNPTTNIRYAVPAESKVVIKVYNMLGQEVRTLVNAVKSAGKFDVAWDGRNNSGQSVASGVYIYRMEAGKFNKAQKMLFIK